MKNLKEYLEKQIDYSLEDGFIIETPYISQSKAAGYETDKLHLLRTGGKTKFYAENPGTLGDFIVKLTSGKDMNQGLLYKSDERIIIYKANKNINDSLKEDSEAINENQRNNTPLQKRKASIIKSIIAHEMDRSEEAIRQAFEEQGPWTAEWNSKTERVQNNHIKMVMDNTKLFAKQTNFDFNDDLENNDSLESQLANAPKRTIKLSVVYTQNESDANEATYMLTKYEELFNPNSKYAPYITYKFKVFNNKASLAFITFPDVMCVKAYIAQILFQNFFDGKIERSRLVAEQDVCDYMIDYLDSHEVMYDGEYEDSTYLSKHLLDLICDTMDLYGLFTEGESYTDSQLDENNGDFLTMEEYIEDQEEYSKIRSGYYDNRTGNAVAVSKWGGSVDGD
ncbi:MAG: hypothetical protein [Wendovervirus sonii]|uniref:Uncharacterized protein n=1 Tax=phage Lak_Megaphage_Sonny TaxID=3109229 RepID=A0ABZ0Z7C1_9CAUD|nr:MAG: hypothetical protein [phage Lak_Megaphage_Sonny]